MRCGGLQTFSLVCHNARTTVRMCIIYNYIGTYYYTDIPLINFLSSGAEKQMTFVSVFNYFKNHAASILFVGLFASTSSRWFSIWHQVCLAAATSRFVDNILTYSFTAYVCIIHINKWCKLPLLFQPRWVESNPIPPSNWERILLSIFLLIITPFVRQPEPSTQKLNKRTNVNFKIST